MVMPTQHAQITCRQSQPLHASAALGAYCVLVGRRAGLGSRHPSECSGPSVPTIWVGPFVRSMCPGGTWPTTDQHKFGMTALAVEGWLSKTWHTHAGNHTRYRKVRGDPHSGTMRFIEKSVGTWQAWVSASARRVRPRGPWVISRVRSQSIVRNAAGVVHSCQFVAAPTQPLRLWYLNLLCQPTLMYVVVPRGIK